MPSPSATCYEAAHVHAGLVKITARESLRRLWAHCRVFGFLDTVAHLAAYHLSRASHDAFDRRHGTETGHVYAMRADDRPAGKQVARSLAIDPRVLHHVLGHLGIDHRDFVFVDLGCGKGRGLLVASDFPFRRIVGVEWSPSLCNIARRNIVLYQAPSRRCADLEVVGGDVRNFVFPPDPLVLYLYNPFGPLLLARVFENIRRHRQVSDRRLLVVYVGMGPLEESMVLDCFERGHVSIVRRYDTLTSAGSWILGEAQRDFATAD